MSPMRNRCYRGGKLHKFRPRYDETKSAVDMSKVERLSGFGAGNVLDSLRDHQIIYKGDVCVWCGKVVNNQPFEDK